MAGDHPIFGKAGPQGAALVHARIGQGTAHCAHRKRDAARGRLVNGRLRPKRLGSMHSAGLCSGMQF